MEICDRAGSSPQSAKDCLRAVLRRLAHPDPHVQVIFFTHNFRPMFYIYNQVEKLRSRNYQSNRTGVSFFLVIG